jgi:hypothetical protein
LERRSTVSSPEILWANRNLAMLARLSKVGTISPVWSKDPDGYRLTIQSGHGSTTAVFPASVLAKAYRGDTSAQTGLIRTLRALVGSISASSEQM